MAITINRVREIIKEELEKLQESEDLDGIKTVVNSSIDLLKALDSFEAKATDSQKSAVSQTIEDLRKHLKTMRDGASSYITTPVTGPKTVVLKKQEDDSGNIKG